MVFSWNHELLDQLDFAWNVQFLPRMQGITDEEYLWEPVDGCLSVRPVGDGTFRLDPNARTSPPPFTTIAWRIGHMTSVFGARASNHFGDASFDEGAVRWPGTAAGALEVLTGQYRLWHDGVESLGEEGLFEPSGPHEGPFAEFPGDPRAAYHAGVPAPCGGSRPSAGPVSRYGRQGHAHASQSSERVARTAIRAISGTSAPVAL